MNFFHFLLLRLSVLVLHKQIDFVIDNNDDLRDLLDKLCDIIDLLLDESVAQKHLLSVCILHHLQVQSVSLEVREGYEKVVVSAVHLLLQGSLTGVHLLHGYRFPTNLWFFTGIRLQ